MVTTWASSLARVLVMPDDFSWLCCTASLIEFDSELSSVRVVVLESDFSRDSPIVFAYEFDRPCVFDEPREMESDSPLLSDRLTDSVMVVLTDLGMLMVQPFVFALHSIGGIELTSLGNPMPLRTIVFGRLSSDGW